MLSADLEFLDFNIFFLKNNLESMQGIADEKNESDKNVAKSVTSESANDGLPVDEFKNMNQVNW